MAHQNERAAAAAAANDEVSADELMKLGLAFWGSKALLSAVELGVFTAVSKGEKDWRQLAAELGLADRGARDFLDTLVALKVLDRRDGRYLNTPAGDKFLVRGKPTYAGGFLEMANARLYPFWGSLTEALKTGRLQNEAKGKGDDFFRELYADEDRLKQFLSSMTGISVPSARALAERFDWSRYKTVVDVGAAQGCVPVTLAKAHPHLRAIGFDLPEVRPIFEAYAKEHGVAARVTFEAGSFFERPIPSADVVVFGHILHDWDLAEKRTLLAKAHDALPKGGAVVVYDTMIDDDRRENALGLLMSLNMLIETRGGFDYTGADCAAWMKEAGFRDVRVRHLCDVHSMAVGIK
jgi:precorrin-6B methylase 2